MSFFEELRRRNVVKMAILYGVASWLILQVANVLFDAFELPPAWIRLVLAALILGFPVTLIVSWVYEMTPDGLKREKDVDPDQSVAQATGRKINLLIVVLLVVAIAVVVVDRLMPETATIAQTPAIDGPTETVAAERSIAVLPFANRSAKEDDAFFVDGIHDDIVTQLARIGSLTVISRTSVEKFRNTSQSMKEIGAVLGVKNILEGGVQRAGDRVRINVQLIDVMTDDHLWAESYDRELTTANIFAIQSEISTAIAEALKATLSPAEEKQLDRIPTDNMAALEAYFLGRQAMTKRTSASLADAEQQFKRALNLDPNYALAYVGLAETYILNIFYNDRPMAEQRTLAEPLIDRALTLNDGLGEAYISKAYLILLQFALMGGDESGDSETLFKKGIDRAPGYVTGHQWYAELLIRQGRLSEALDQLNEAVRLDPLSGIVRIVLGSTLESLGRFDEARLQYESIVRNDPAFAAAYSFLGMMHWAVYGRLDDAMLRLRQAAALDPGNPQYSAFLTFFWSDLGENAEADRWADKTRTIAGSSYWYHAAASYVSVSRGEVAGASGNAEAMLAEFPVDFFALWTLGLNDLRAGHADTAVTRYRAAYPGLLDAADPAINLSNFRAAVDLAYLLQATGDHARANRLLDRSLAYVLTIPRLGRGGHGIADVRIYAMQRKEDLALTALRQAVNAGWRLTWPFSLKHDPPLNTLHSKPEYLAIVAELEADMASQLKHVREMEANGEMAPIAD